MAVPYVFANATSAIPLSNLDNNFSTPVTIGNVAIQLGNTATTLSNLSLANVTITSSSISNITGSTANAVVYANTTSALITGTGLQFDGTNLGLAVTPSAWGGGFKVIETQGGSIGSSGTSTFRLGNNEYYNGTNWIYKNTATASRYELDGNSHVWYIAPSGTAGNTITWTTAMTLDANGSLALGGTTVASSNGGMTITGTNSGGLSSPFALRNGGTANGSGVYWTYRGVTNTGAENDYAYMIMVSDNTTAKTGSIRFATGNGSSPVEAMRITSDGNLLVGTTTPSGNGERINVTGSSTSFIAAFLNSSTGSRRGFYCSYTGSSPPNDNGNEFLYCNDNSALRMAVLSNGGIKNYAANNVVLSDRREKTNFAPATAYLDKICAIPVQTFNYIDQNLEADPDLTLGVVAQDMQSIAPELVTEGNWGTEENPKIRLEIYQTDLQYALMKCIQELNTLITAQSTTIQSLTDRITALEAK